MTYALCSDCTTDDICLERSCEMRFLAREASIVTRCNAQKTHLEAFESVSSR